MNEFERRITGKTIHSIKTVMDYVQIFFVDGGSLNLYNPVTSSEFRAFSDGFVEFAKLDTKHLVLKTRDENEITMSCLDKDYSGPEAYYFVDSDETMITG